MARGFVERFLALNPDYRTDWVEAARAPWAAGAVRLHSGSSANGLWVGGFDNQVGITNPDLLLDTATVSLKIVQARVPEAFAGISAFLRVGRRSAEGDTRNTAVVFFTRNFGEPVKAHVGIDGATISPGDPAVAESAGWVGELWLTFTRTATTVTAALWTDDPVFGGTPIAYEQRARDFTTDIGEAEAGVFLRANSDQLDYSLVISDWSYQELPPPLPSIILTGGRRGQIALPG